VKIKKYIASKTFLRKIFFPIFRKLDFYFLIVHPITFRPFFLKFWSHKGYWYYGKNREENEIALLKKLLKKGDKILEVGAHIGFMTQIFESLVTENGQVLAVEPSPINSKFLKLNTKTSTDILPLALSDEIKKGYFYMDSYGGFTNSIKKDHAEERNIFFSKKQSSKVQPLTRIDVNIKTIDSICKEKKYKPNFIKIDVEGSEYNVIRGSLKTLEFVNIIMIEIRKDNLELFELLESKNFIPLNENGEKISYLEIDKSKFNNYFFIKAKDF
tara:strand:+ start:4237 stop:5049 length:813 start_codon:yes stop_codon:yes gene_type:complete